MVLIMRRTSAQGNQSAVDEPYRTFRRCYMSTRSLYSLRLSFSEVSHSLCRSLCVVYACDAIPPPCMTCSTFSIARCCVYTWHPCTRKKLSHFRILSMEGWIVSEAIWHPPRNSFAARGCHSSRTSRPVGGISRSLAAA